MKILVVDDDTGTLNALKASLISVGYQVEVAEGASQALTRAVDHRRRDYYHWCPRGAERTGGGHRHRPIDYDLTY